MLRRKYKFVGSLCLLALLIFLVENYYADENDSNGRKAEIRRRLNTRIGTKRTVEETKSKKLSIVNRELELPNVLTDVESNVTIEPQHVISDARINVIIAYMRTGSSFVAGTLKAYPNTFYLYEPIRDIWEKFWYDPQPVTPVLYPNGTTLYYNLEDRSRVVLQEIINFMTCNFGNLSMITLIARKRKVKELSNFMLFDINMCTRNHEQYVNKSKSLFEIKTWTQCLEEMRSKCLKASVRLLKFIRIPLSDIRKLLPYFPNLKVLHLNRDPRGIFNSRKHIRGTPQKATNKEVIKHCEDWLNDIEDIEIFSTEIPDRFRVVRYEDIAQNVTKYFKNICAFFEMEFEPEMKAYLINITNAERDGNRWELNREDPYRTATKWRTELAFFHSRFIGGVCSKGMKRMKYYQFTRERYMRNFKFDDRGDFNLLNAI